MPDLPKVTIAMPVFNGGRYFELALQSALDQSYANIEIIIVNDGSTDDGATDRIASRYRDLHGDRIRYIAQENMGVGGALNTVIDHADGQYFCWLSHDDLFLREKTARQISYLQELGAPDTPIFADFDLMDADGNALPKPPIRRDYFANNPLLALLNSGINGCTVMIPMWMMRRYGPFDSTLRHTQDYDLWNRILLKHDFIFQEETLVRYRLHDAQGTRETGAAIEGDPLWIRILDDRSDIARAQMFGSSTMYYRRMADFLRQTPYEKALRHAETRAEAPTDLTLVSIILRGSDDVDALIRTAISILDQSHARIELLLCATTSLHDAAMRDPRLSSDPRLRWIKAVDERPLAPVNRALLAARGLYVAFAEAGAHFMPTRIAVQFEAMIDKGWLVSQTAYCVNCPAISTKRTLVTPARTTPDEARPLKRLLEIELSAVMIHRLIIAEGFRFDEHADAFAEQRFMIEVMREHAIEALDTALTDVAVPPDAPILDISNAEPFAATMALLLREDEKAGEITLDEIFLKKRLADDGMVRMPRSSLASAA